MAENTPNVPAGTPIGATPPPPAPPKPGESGKIQPKKETVRINLPPKPTAAPTIKIPAPSAISAAAPAAAASAAPAAARPAAVAPAAGTGAAKPAGATAAPAAAPAKGPATAAAPVAARPAPVVYSTGGLDTVDKAMAIGAAVVAVLVLVRVFMLTS